MKIAPNMKGAAYHQSNCQLLPLYSLLIVPGLQPWIKGLITAANWAQLLPSEHGWKPDWYRTQSLRPVEVSLMTLMDTVQIYNGLNSESVCLLFSEKTTCKNLHMFLILDMFIYIYQLQLQGKSDFSL